MHIVASGVSGDPVEERFLVSINKTGAAPAWLSEGCSVSAIPQAGVLAIFLVAEQVTMPVFARLHRLDTCTSLGVQISSHVWQSGQLRRYSKHRQGRDHLFTITAQLFESYTYITYWICMTSQSPNDIIFELIVAETRVDTMGLTIPNIWSRRWSDADVEIWR